MNSTIVLPSHSTIVLFISCSTIDLLFRVALRYLDGRLFSCSTTGDQCQVATAFLSAGGSCYRPCYLPPVIMLTNQPLFLLYRRTTWPVDNCLYISHNNLVVFLCHQMLDIGYIVRYYSFVG